MDYGGINLFQKFASLARSRSGARGVGSCSSGTTYRWKPLDFLLAGQLSGLSAHRPKGTRRPALPLCDVSGGGWARSSVTSQARSPGSQTVARSRLGLGWASRVLEKVTAWPRRYLGRAGGEKVSGRRGFNERTISKGHRRQSVSGAPRRSGPRFPKT